MGDPTRSRGWQVAAAGTGINLALGVLYSWSIFKVAIKESIEHGGAFHWDLAALNDPYSAACLAFALSMFVAGRVQDTLGPRLTAFIGGVLVGLGFLLVSQSTAYVAWVVGFGLLAGIGFGFGYCAATPPALKWFPPAKTGMVAGIVVSGFGLASVYIAPLSRWLIARHGLPSAMMILGIGFVTVVSVLSRFLVNPPATAAAARGAARATSAAGEMTPSQMLRTRTAWLLWATFFIGAGAGLMIIGSISELAKKSLGEAAFVAVIVMAVGNAGGRIVAGVASDRFGRQRTLTAMLAFQAVLMFLAAFIAAAEGTNPVLCLGLATLIGFNYGGNLSLFPAFTKDRFGLRHFGQNYGLIFTAWGIGGFVMSRLSQTLYATTHSYRPACFIACGLLIAGALLSLTLRERARAVVTV